MAQKLSKGESDSSQKPYERNSYWFVWKDVQGDTEAEAPQVIYTFDIFAV